MTPNTATDKDSQVHADDKGEIMQNGVPVHASDEEPHEEAKGLPTSDRQFSETAAARHGGNADAPKHEHGKDPAAK